MREIATKLARCQRPAIFSNDGDVASRAASPQSVDVAQNHAINSAFDTLEALASLGLTITRTDTPDALREAVTDLLSVMDYGDEDPQFTDDESVAWTSSGDDPMTFGHIRRVREALPTKWR